MHVIYYLIFGYISIESDWQMLNFREHMDHLNPCFQVIVI